MLKPRQEDYVLLMAARVGDAKDHETLVRAFELARVQCSLVLVGRTRFDGCFLQSRLGVVFLCLFHFAVEGTNR